VQQLVDEMPQQSMDLARYEDEKALGCRCPCCARDPMAPREMFDAPAVRWSAVEFFGVPLMWDEHMYIGIQILQAAREGG
jgi:hypothetical protein